MAINWKKGWADLGKAIRQSLRDSNEWFFWLCALWTLALLVMNYVEFFTARAYRLTMISTISYVGFVTTYVANKEINKWTISNIKLDKPGQLFVYFWGFTLLLIIVIRFFTGDKYQIPEQLPYICGGIVTVFVGGEASKNLRQKRSKK